MNNFILIGFDRSGTSAISRTLAQHPQIELIFRPFNSGPIRKKMYEVLSDQDVTNQDIKFFSYLERGKLDSSYFNSEWHTKFSTVKDSFKDGKTHVIITNINHFTVKWVNENFPLQEQWAIWRNPFDILNSCVKNKFYGEWYNDALEQVFKTVRNNSDLVNYFLPWESKVKDSNMVIKTAYLLAVRNYFLFSNIAIGKVVDYEIFKSNPNKALEPILNSFRLDSGFDFSNYLNEDLNSIPSIDGYKPNKKSTVILSEEEMSIAKLLFEPLIDLYQSKFKS